MTTKEPTIIVRKLSDPRSFNWNNQIATLAYHNPTRGRKTENPFLLLKLSPDDPLSIEVLPLLHPSHQELRAHDKTISFLRSEKIAFTPRKMLTACITTPSMTTHISSNRGRMFLHGKPLYLKQNFAVQRETWIDPSKLTTLPTNFLHFSEQNSAGEVLSLDEESSYRLMTLVSQYKSTERPWNLVRSIEAAMVRSGWISTFGAWNCGNRHTEIEAEDGVIRELLKELKALVGVVDDVKELEPIGVTWGGKVEGEGGIIEKMVTTKDKKAVFEGFLEVEKSGEGDWLLVSELGLDDQSVRI